MELWYGCKTLFSREAVMECSGCNYYAMFCNKGYDGNYWPKHREHCKLHPGKQKRTVELRELTHTNIDNR